LSGIVPFRRPLAPRLIGWWEIEDKIALYHEYLGGRAKT
jgi:hypothetical protein